MLIHQEWLYGRIGDRRDGGKKSSPLGLGF